MNTREDHAVTFVELVEELIVASVRGSLGPGQCIAALKVATVALSLELEPNVVKAGRAFAKEFATEIPEGALRGLARSALEESGKASPDLMPDTVLKDLVACATNAIGAIGQKDALFTLVVLQLAAHMSMTILKSQSTEDELAMKLTRLLAARRAIARVDVEVHQMGPMSRGGDA